MALLGNGLRTSLNEAQRSCIRIQDNFLSVSLNLHDDYCYLPKGRVMRIFLFKLCLGAAVVITGCRLFPPTTEHKSPNTPHDQKSPPRTAIHHPLLGPNQFLETDVEWNPEGIVLYKKTMEPASGSLVRFFPAGQMRSAVQFVDGRREGTAKWWGSDGELRHTRQYEQGRLHGSWVEYYPGTDEPRQEQVFVDGREILRRGWWPNGEKQFEVLFVNGEEKSRKAWNIEGNMTASSSPSQPLDGNRTKLP